MRKALQAARDKEQMRLKINALEAECTTFQQEAIKLDAEYEEIVRENADLESKEKLAHADKVKGLKTENENTKIKIWDEL